MLRNREYPRNEGPVRLCPAAHDAPCNADRSLLSDVLSYVGGVGTRVQPAPGIPYQDAGAQLPREPHVPRTHVLGRGATHPLRDSAGDGDGRLRW
jgi:hypothetical protein